MKHLYIFIFFVFYLTYCIHSESPGLSETLILIDTPLDGYHIRNEGGFRYEETYKNGKKNGICKSYYRNGKISSICEYKNGYLTGNCYLFHEDGRPIVMEKVKLNKSKYIKDRYGKKVKLLYESEYSDLYPNGNKMNFGICLYEMSSDYESIRYGKWLFYDSTGKITSIKNYKDNYTKSGP